MMAKTFHNTYRRRCRVCLTETGEDFQYLLEPLYEKDNEKDTEDEMPTLLDCFNKCTQLRVTASQLKRESWAARFLCSNCRNELQTAYHFIKKAELSDEYLKNQKLSHLKNEQHAEIVQNELDLEPAFNKESNVGPNTCTEIVNFELVESDSDSVLSKKNETAQNIAERNNTSIEAIDVEFQRHRSELIEYQIETCEPQGSPKSIATDIPETYVNYEFEVERLDEEFDSDVNETIEITAMGSPQDRINTVDTDDESTCDSALKPQSDSCISENERRSKHFEFDCELCPERFQFQSNLLQHYDVQHSADAESRFRCETCNKHCVTKIALRIHVRQAHMGGTYVNCDKCGRMVLKSFYKIHLQKHEKKPSFLCNVCSSTFSQKHLLMKHLEIHSPTRDRKIKCNICAREFFSVENLNAHMEIHQAERITYTCPLCAKSFLRQTNLKQHMQWHRGETMNCPYCNKEFVRSTDLEIHIRFHTGNFPYACTKCDRRFAIKSHINEHMKRHEGVRYKCALCAKEFINVSGLKQHSYEHTGMPYSCDICKRGFPTKFKTRRHLRSVHKDLFNDGNIAALVNAYISDNRNSKNEMENIEEEYFDMDETAGELDEIIAQ